MDGGQACSLLVNPLNPASAISMVDIDGGGCGKMRWNCQRASSDR